MNTAISCIRVSDVRLCPYCKSSGIVKNGHTKTGKQQYLCKYCKKRFIDYYTYSAYQEGVNSYIIQLTKEGLGIRSTARVLHISTTTLLKRIMAIARDLSKPVIRKGKTYEVDELCTFIKQKSRRIWVVYALERKSRAVVSFATGTRTNKTLNRVLSTLKLSEAYKIYTDGLKHYKSLIESAVHRVSRYGTNHIERKNLSLRTHLKRLGRKTICFTRSLVVLGAILSIYFWA
ncbi:MAG TPA: IS1 family transposase [Edaphocola sp.]|nr:IS1 family transposase [Edaphocola sp.]